MFVRNFNRRAELSFAALTLACTTAFAGPPLICQPFNIGNAQTISEKTRDVVNDTLGALKTADSILARMETLRRATVRLDGDKSRAQQLLSRLAYIALDLDAGAQESGKPAEAAAAWFQAGYFAAGLQQMGIDIDWKPGVAEGIQGYAWVRRALKLAPDNAEMQFAAALMTHPAMSHSTAALYEEHLKKAQAGAAEGSLLKQNLAAHVERWAGQSGGQTKTDSATARGSR
ncbi:MAG: hypothetical protein U1D55_05220 [Phycisphaerae bacterium]